MRDDFSIETKRIIATRVNWVCSNPDCRAVTSGPQLDPAKVTNIGVAAHITAASVGGKRYDDNISQEERKHPSNGIWLCQNCAKKIDDDEQFFTKSLLHKWKESAELSAEASLGKAKAEFEGHLGDIGTEEIDLLCAAASSGSINVLEVYEICPWVLVDGIHFADETDPAFALAYFDALQSLEKRGLVRPAGGNLYSLTTAGFKLARALSQSRADAAAAEEIEDDSEDSLLFEDRVKIPPEEFVPFPFQLSEHCGIRYVVDADGEVEVLIVDQANYKQFRNKDEVNRYYAHHDDENQQYVDEELWPDKGGEFFLIVWNPGNEKIKVDVLGTLLETE